MCPVLPRRARLIKPARFLRSAPCSSAPLRGDLRSFVTLGDVRCGVCDERRQARPLHGRAVSFSRCYLRVEFEQDGERVGGLGHAIGCPHDLVEIGVRVFKWMIAGQLKRTIKFTEG